MKKNIFAMLLVFILAFSAFGIPIAATAQPNVQAYGYSISYDIAHSRAIAANYAPQVVNRIDHRYIQCTL